MLLLFLICRRRFMPSLMNSNLPPDFSSFVRKWQQHLCHLLVFTCNQMRSATCSDLRHLMLHKTSTCIIYIYIYIYVCTYKHINTATNVLINHKTVKPGNHNCDSANVVYLIHCKKCPEALYIGETGGNFRYRFNNHTHSIRQK